MAQTEAQKQAVKRYRSSEKAAQIVLKMRAIDKATWDEYAAFKGLPLATLIRQLMANSMAADEWKTSIQPEKEE